MGSVRLGPHLVQVELRNKGHRWVAPFVSLLIFLGGTYKCVVLAARISSQQLHLHFTLPLQLMTTIRAEHVSQSSELFFSRNEVLTNLRG